MAIKPLSESTIFNAFVPGQNYSFSTITADSDPGNGNLRLDNASYSSVSMAYISTTDNLFNSMVSWVISLSTSTNAVKGTLRLTGKANPNKWAEFAVTGPVIADSGYYKIPLEYNNSSGTFSDNEELKLTFARAGNAGSGDVSGPNSSTDNAFAVFDGTTGKLLKAASGAPEVTSNKGQADGYAPLNSSNQIPATHLTAFMPRSGGTFTGEVFLYDDPNEDMHPVNKRYLDEKLEELDYTTAIGSGVQARLATTSNITIPTGLYVGQVIDGVALTANNVILVKNQVNRTQNGIYRVISTSSAVRHPAFVDMEAFEALIVLVTDGSMHANSMWSCASNGTIEFSDINFTRVIQGNDIIDCGTWS